MGERSNQFIHRQEIKELGKYLVNLMCTDIMAHDNYMPPQKVNK